MDWGFHVRFFLDLHVDYPVCTALMSAKGVLPVDDYFLSADR
jgi:hypothetical protein